MQAERWKKVEELYEAAEALHVHPNTVIRDWNMARVWLKHELTRGKPAHAG